MKKSSTIIVLILFLAIIGLGYFSYYSLKERKEIEDQISQLKTDLSELNDQIDQLEQENQEKQEKINYLQQQISQISQKLNNTKETLEDTRDNLEGANTRISVLEEEIQVLSQELNQTKETISYLRNLTTTQNASYAVAAVNDTTGQIIDMEVRIEKGNDHILIDTTNVIFNFDTQESTRTAFEVAQEFTGRDLINREVELEIINPYEETLKLSGPSAGAAQTLAMIATINNKTISKNTLITGTIDQNGTIGKVGEIEKKAKAAKTYGAEQFLVPNGQYVSIDGIEVIEVNDIKEATDYIEFN